MTIEYLAELRRQYRATHADEPALDRAAPAPASPGAEDLPNRIERVRRAAMIRVLDAELAQHNTAVTPLSRRLQNGRGTKHEDGGAAVVVPFPGPRLRRH